MIIILYFATLLIANLEFIFLNTKQISSRFQTLCLFALILLFASCNPTKHLSEGDYLLNSNIIVIQNQDSEQKKTIKADLEQKEINRYIRQKPNKKIFGARYHLFLYNSANPEKERGVSRLLRRMGEEPVIYDEYATEQSVEQIKQYISANGYFDSDVTSSVVTKKKEAIVTYTIDAKAPYTIKDIAYYFDDPQLFTLFKEDAANTLLTTNSRYNEEILKSERGRFAEYVRNQGFYSFTEDNISFVADSTVGNHQVSIDYKVSGYVTIDSANNVVTTNFTPYRLRDIYLFSEFDPKEILQNSEDYLANMDTTEYNGVYYISPSIYSKPTVRYNILNQSLYLRKGDIFSTSDTRSTEARLKSLNLYRLVNIYYQEADSDTAERVNELDAIIQLTRIKQQSYKVDVEGTNTTGDLGGGISLTYTHNNLFRGAERLDISLRGSYEVVRQRGVVRYTQEYGVNMDITFPRFIFPFLSKGNFTRRYNPTTTLSASYDYQDFPMYNRSLTNMAFSYKWTSNNFSSFTVTPIQFNQIDMISIDSTFQKNISVSTFLMNSFKDVSILGGAMSYVFSNQSSNNKDDYIFLRINFEPAGNLIGFFRKPLSQKRDSDGYYLFGQPFAQFVKTDLDLRFNKRLNDASAMAYRLFIGAGIPYGNSKALPFERQYYGGGANGIRAWQVRTLGPGSYVADKSNFLNQTGDIRIEANAEYRFKLFSIVEGALFVDAGNIWAYNYDSSQEGSNFRFDKFLDDVAVGTGVGLRLNLNFLLLRADMGIKMRDPAIASGSKWILSNRSLNFKNDFAFVIAIGYPF